MKIISFSLWGSNRLYLTGAKENLEIAKRIYPGWTCRFYYDETVPSETIGFLDKNGAETVLIDSTLGKWEGLFWRFYPIEDSSVEAFIVRDTDSRLTTRERNAVEDWIKSDKGLHTMRDHWNHNVPILGGMWGMKRSAIDAASDVLDLLKSWTFKDKGSDQVFLEKHLWPKTRDTALAHDRYPNGFFRLPDRSFRMPEQIEAHERYDGDKDFPRGKIVLKDGTVFQRLDVYAYDPVHLFGQHEVRSFPDGDLEYGHFIGEPSFDYNRPYNEIYQDYI